MEKKTNYASLKFCMVSILFFLTLSCSKKEPQVDPKSINMVPSISTLAPQVGTAETEVTINGDNFGNTLGSVKVTFGSKIGVITSVSDKIIKVKAPSGYSNISVDVSVSIGYLTSNKKQFSFLSDVVPTIQTVTPTCFYNSTVVITGADFSPNIADNVVKFGSVNATITAASFNKLTVTAPDLGAATNSQITVTSFNKTSLPTSIDVDQDQNKIAKYSWTSTTTKPGVIYKKGNLALFAGSTRYLYVLDVELNASNTLGIGFSTTNATTTNMATSYNAVAAVNAGYFKLSQTYDKNPFIRINGTTVQDGDLDVTQVFTNSALIINNNIAKVRKFTDAGKNLNLIAAAIPPAQAANVLVCGPMLITDGVIEDVDLSVGHNTSITARTGLGVSADGKRVIMVVVDSGGSSTGVSTPQLAKILQALGALNAMNMDGGGSSTMFVKDQGLNGLVNLPYGAPSERAVASIIYVR